MHVMWCVVWNGVPYGNLSWWPIVMQYQIVSRAINNTNETKNSMKLTISDGRSVLLINPTNIMSQQQKLDFVVSAVTGVHYNPWTNMCVESVDNGDIVFMDCREMHYELVLGRKFGERRILSSMDIKQLDGTPLKRLTDVKENEKLQMEWSMYDNDYKEKYGLVLQPLIKVSALRRDGEKIVYK